jgi:hypothetical protein
VTRDQIFNELVARSVAKVIISFSGGNDEGGVDQIQLLYNNEVVEYIDEYWPVPKYDEATKTWIKPERTYEQTFQFYLTKPIYNKYHTFAGDWYVNGELVWDVTKRSVTMNGSQTVE